MCAHHETSNAGSDRFTTTRWTWVCAAQDLHNSGRADALASLCETYWYPLYAYVRRRGHSAHEAEDLTQEFFRRLLERDYLKAADSEKGRFRTFLLVAMKRFMANEWHRARAQKRGGAQPHFSIDAAKAEEMFHYEPVEKATPESLYDRRWALSILEQAVALVRQDMEQSGKSELFAALKDALTGKPADYTYAEIGAGFGLTEGAVKATVHRLRKRFRKHVYQVVRDTVCAEENIEDEVHHLISVLEG